MLFLGAFPRRIERGGRACNPFFSQRCYSVCWTGSTAGRCKLSTRPSSRLTIEVLNMGLVSTCGAQRIAASDGRRRRWPWTASRCAPAPAARTSRTHHPAPGCRTRRGGRLACPFGMEPSGLQAPMHLPASKKECAFCRSPASQMMAERVLLLQQQLWNARPAASALRVLASGRQRVSISPKLG